MRKTSIFPIWGVALLLIFLTTTACSITYSTDGTTDFLSSTSGKTWWTEDGLVKQGEHARAFVFVNYDNLLSNIAKGGESISWLWDRSWILSIRKFLPTAYSSTMPIYHSSMLGKMTRLWQNLSMSWFWWRKIIHRQVYNIRPLVMIRTEPISIFIARSPKGFLFWIALPRITS